ncbi:MAG: hypothetical protein ACRC62_38330 [Microcoleus sp.]
MLSNTRSIPNDRGNAGLIRPLDLLPDILDRVAGNIDLLILGF